MYLTYNINKTMHVCYFGTYRTNYSRNRILIEGLRQNGVEVTECNVPLWQGVEDRVQAASGGWIRPSFWWRVFITYFRLLIKYRSVKNYDILMVGYPGQIDVILAKILSVIYKKPLIWDIFMSIYLIACERGLNKYKFTIKLIYMLERFATKLPDLLIIDTQEYMNWFVDQYQIPPQKFRLVPTGADDRIFYPIPKTSDEDPCFRVLYYGSFIKNHGVEYIIEAANLLSKQKNIHFILIGDGPEKKNAIKLIDKYNLQNITFFSWIDKNELRQFIANADICLGAFGETPQSIMTIQNKIYESMAMAKPIITGESPAVNRLLTHKIHVYLCKRKNPSSLAEAIIDLMNNPKLQEVLSKNGYKIFLEEYSLRNNGIRLLNLLSELYSP